MKFFVVYFLDGQLHADEFDRRLDAEGFLQLCNSTAYLIYGDILEGKIK